MSVLPADSISSDQVRLGKRVFAVIAWLGRCVLTTLLFPVRMIASIRRSATPSSVTLLLFSIVSLNILWGYPWVGIFASCVSMMLIGLLVNQLMKPWLLIDFLLPRSVEAGQTFSLRVHLKNRRRVPALQLIMQFDKSPPFHVSRLKRLLGKHRALGKHGAMRNDLDAAYELKAPPPTIPTISSRGMVSVEASMRYLYRGVHPLPDVRVKSLFPFCLFESTAVYPSTATIAVTPRLVTESDSCVSNGQLADLSAWSRYLRSTDAHDYAGSREYDVGMPVRRWDFASWARLGRPIVREFQQPGVQTILMFVDTATDTKTLSNRNRDEAVEHVLSLAATAMTDLRQRSIHVRMMVAGEDLQSLEERNRSSSHATDFETLLIRLAQAKYTSAAESDAARTQISESMPGTPLLVLTARQEAVQPTPGGKVIRIDVPHQAVNVPQAKNVFKKEV